MENAKAFQERNLIGICEYINKYCEIYINNVPILSGGNVKAFHTFFPTLLVCIFGAPTKRGWIQTELNAAQSNAVKNLLCVNGQFFQALIKLSTYPEYTFDLITDTLPADVKKVLSSGSIHLLPKVYSNCSYIVTSYNSSSIDIRAAATRQSTLLPMIVGGDRKIKFNMLQFYLYYFISVPTWPPLTPPPTNNYSNKLTNTSRTPAYGTPAYGTSAYGTSRLPTTTQINTQNSTNSNTTSHYQIPGILQPITQGIYSNVLEEYLYRFIPIQSNLTFTPIVGSFFLDACIELWIRTTWVAANQKISVELMNYITVFVQYIVKHDLKQCFSNEKSLLALVYIELKDELYMLISRLAINWSKQDDYVHVVNLWSLWAAPWKLGNTPRSSDTLEYSPIQSGWSKFILDNLPCYFFLVDIFLQRTSTFTYKESLQTTPNVPLSNYTDSGTIGGQLRILCRLINVLKAKGLVEFLELVENSFVQLKTGFSSLPSDPFKKLSWHCYGTDSMDYLVLKKMTAVYDVFVALEGVNGFWKPKGLYAQDMMPRSDALLKTLNAINAAAVVHEAKGWNTQAANNTRSVQYATQLKEVGSKLHKTLKVIGDGHLTPNIDDTKTTNKVAQPIGKNVKIEWIRPRCVGSGGFLTSEEKEAIKQGKAMCSYDNIPAVGVRAVSYIRSYEISSLVRWTVQMDAKINHQYNKYLPPDKRPKFLPQQISLRFLARRVNFVYIIATLLLLMYIFVKVIIYKWF